MWQSSVVSIGILKLSEMDLGFPPYRKLFYHACRQVTSLLPVMSSVNVMIVSLFTVKLFDNNF
jgi:hypothetical protein